jgi:hypothetical protein
MSDMKTLIDLWDLFQTGQSKDLVFGHSTPEIVARVIGEPDSDGEGPIPFSSWITEIDHFEFFFQGAPPRLYGLKMNPPGYAIGIGGGRLVDRRIAEIETDNAALIFHDIDWSSLLVLPRALARLWEKASKVEATDDKMVVLKFNKEHRQLSLTYALQPKQLEGGFYDFDYHFYALHLNDWAADAELSKTLPSGSSTRDQKLREVAEFADSLSKDTSDGESPSQKL